MRYGAGEGQAGWATGSHGSRPYPRGAGHNGRMEPKKRRPKKAAPVLIGFGHMAVTAFTWRDIKRRQPSQIRGNKRVWRALTALNTGNSALYWLIGRRR